MSLEKFGIYAGATLALSATLFELSRIFLAQEPITNPDFIFFGLIVVGGLTAIHFALQNTGSSLHR